LLPVYPRARPYVSQRNSSSEVLPLIRH